jgi:hypothetical protein
MFFFKLFSAGIFWWREEKDCKNGIENDDPSWSDTQILRKMITIVSGYIYTHDESMMMIKNKGMEGREHL